MLTDEAAANTSTGAYYTLALMYFMGYFGFWMMQEGQLLAHWLFFLGNVCIWLYLADRMCYRKPFVDILPPPRP